MIRKAGTEDIPAIREMADVVFRQTYREILSPAQMEYMMNMMYSVQSLEAQMLREGNIFFIEDGGGYVSYRPDGWTEDGRERFHLEKLYVLPEHQGTGLGRRLFETVLIEAKATRGAEATSRTAATAPIANGATAKAAGGAEATSRTAATAPIANGATAKATESATIRIELNVNRNNPALGFYEHMGMRRDREGDFPIGGGFYMNDYIMAIDI